MEKPALHELLENRVLELEIQQSNHESVNEESSSLLVKQIDALASRLDQIERRVTSPAYAKEILSGFEQEIDAMFQRQFARLDMKRKDFLDTERRLLDSSEKVQQFIEKEKQALRKIVEDTTTFQRESVTDMDPG